MRTDKTFCYSKTTDEPIYSALPSNVVWEACFKLFGSATIGNMKIFNFIQSQYMKLETCVLWKRNKKFLELCKKDGLEIGNQEIIITQSGEILYSNNYHNKPVSTT